MNHPDPRIPDSPASGSSPGVGPLRVPPPLPRTNGTAAGNANVSPPALDNGLKSAVPPDLTRTPSPNLLPARDSLPPVRPEAPAPVQRVAPTPVATPSANSRWKMPEEPSEETPPEDLLEPVKKSMPAWLVSMIFHTVLLLILALITTPVGQGVSRLVLEFGEAETEADVDLDVFAIDPADALAEDAQSDVELPVDLSIESLMSPIAVETDLTMEPVEIGEGPAIDVSQPMFSGRSGAMKKALLALYGGSSETVEAVQRGLRWLSRQQERRGSWSMRGPYIDTAFAENRPAATAMALLAFLGDGHTHQSGEYADVVDRGLKFLLSEQSRDGYFCKSVRGDERAYAQAQATIVLCEAYGLTKDSTLRAPAQAAIDWAVQAQSNEGGWRYQPRFDSDISVSGWFVMALMSARSAELDVPGDCLYKVNRYLDSVQEYDGAAYGYQAGRPPTPPMTAEGLLCRQYLGWARNRPQMKEGIELLTTDGPFDVRNPNVYYWYYATQVLHHYGGPEWESWNRQMKVKLPDSQVKRGEEAGSWSPQADQWGRTSGRLYTTCLTIYCLEVYYRHLPIYQSEKMTKD